MARLLRYTSKRSAVKPHSLSNRFATWFLNAASFCCYCSLLVPFVWFLNIVVPFWFPDVAGVVGALPVLSFSQGVSWFGAGALAGIISFLIGFSLE